MLYKMYIIYVELAVRNTGISHASYIWHMPLIHLELQHYQYPISPYILYIIVEGNLAHCANIVSRPPSCVFVLAWVKSVGCCPPHLPCGWFPCHRERASVCHLHHWPGVIDVGAGNTMLLLLWWGTRACSHMQDWTCTQNLLARD